MSSHGQTHRSFHNHTHNHSSPNYYYGNHQQQQRGYNRRRRANYQSSRRHHSVHNNPRRNYSSFGGSGSYTAADHEDFARQFSDQYQTPVIQPPLPYYSGDIVLSSVVVNNQSPYGLIWNYPLTYYEQIDDVYVVNDPSELNQTSGMLDYELIDDNSSETSGMLYYINFMASHQERNSRFDFGPPSDYLFYLLDDMYDHDEEKEDDDDVLKYLKIRTHYAPAKDGVVADVESEICAICQSEYEHEENIGALQCGHEYHTDCIKQWLLKKKDCPMCRASVLPSQE